MREIEPAISDVNTLVEVLNGVVHRLNTAINDVNTKNYGAAEKGLREARDEFNRSDLPFQSLGQRQKRGQFRRLYELSMVNRDIQKQMLGLTESIISQGKTGNIDAYNKLIEEYNKLSATYNSKINEINEALRRL